MNLLTTTVPTRSSAECQHAVERGAGGGLDDAEGVRDDELDTVWSGAQEPGLGVAGLAARRITGAASPVGDRAARHRLDRELLGIGERFRSEEHTSEIQSLMRIAYVVFCLQKKKK